MLYFLHQHFPYLSNVIHDAGVGPVTLPDVFFRGLPRPSFGDGAWLCIEALLFVGAWFLVPALSTTRALANESSLGGEIALFALLLSVSSLALVVQAFQLELFDRYLIAPLFSLVLFFAICADRRWNGRRIWGSALALAPVAWFAIAGVHDYFRWNDARWQLVAELTRNGVKPENLEGGYEVDGWLNYDAALSGRHPSSCIGPCGCAVQWSPHACTDDSYQISMNPLSGYETISSREVQYWLVPTHVTLLALRRASAVRPQ
jgi:hypothetical protein